MSMKRAIKAQSSDDEEYQCQLCKKNFSSQNLYQRHMKIKHNQSSKVKKEETPNLNNQEFYSQFQDIQDRILAFLGELGQKYSKCNKNHQNDLPIIKDKEDQSQDSEQNRTLYDFDFYIVKDPYEEDFEVLNVMKDILLPTSIVSQQLHLKLKLQIQDLMNKILEQKQKWQFIDPIELFKLRDEEFTLINISSVIRNHQKKQVQLIYKQFVIFVLWLTKICKVSAWKEFYSVFVYITSLQVNYSHESSSKKEETSWKKFQKAYKKIYDTQFPEILLDNLRILKYDDIIDFLKLYCEWVKYSTIYS